MTQGSQIDLFPAVTDPTGAITQSASTQIGLAPGVYLVAEHVSGIFRQPNYMQVTPFYNGTPHLENGIYFAVNAEGGGSAAGSVTFLLYAPSDTTLSLTYSGSSNATDGQINLTILRLGETA